MKVKKLAAVLIIILITFYGGKFILKEYVFPFKHKEAIMKYSEENDLDPYFVLAVIRAESGFDTGATSHKNAMGLMQITDDTGKWIAEKMGLKDYTPDKLYDDEYNIKMGCWYLNNLRDEFKDVDLFVAAYNAGRGNVKEWLKNKEYSSNGKTLDYIPYKETKEYVDKVKTYYNIYKKIYE
ncbi:MAG: lytic transglycosylase domain-containing protein [Clostridium sp.]|uniref:lytic transglycosylase domain-containing protein n=1 Tax=Clostridium sp. DSM 8431 TaxID=1761781 RepID=UPI0008EC5FC5|nr:lytic transglycosylase domain-containing protein [Clostridium sp. DSM 8431]MCR4944671.1 lytic transglycosylase domain-containing protein [Clostridium sp.]SFU54273.1 soluble lytic murein transglycosylase [Clostridium sp. DSM 8431]